ncbi:MAG: SpoIID/LytB domain-containing protein [Terriglobales bacterium]
MVALLLVLPAAAAASTVRVGVFGLFHPRELIVRPAPGAALEVQADRRIFLLYGAQRARLRISGEKVEFRIGDRTVLASCVRISPREAQSPDFLLSVPGRIERRFRGNLEVTAAKRELMPVVSMDLEVAVASAVAAESPPGASLEALKAQAVVTRSYYVVTRGRHVDFDFCDTTHCQFLRHPPSANHPGSLAAAETEGLVLAYRDAPLAALFSANCGGRTRTLAELGIATGGYPYYSVECPSCRTGSPVWEAQLDWKDAAPLVTGKNLEQARLELGRKLGWGVVPGSNYQGRRQGEKLVFRGRGAGHGVGLCQKGAAAMAAEGATFREILARYFPNTALIAADRQAKGR